MDHFVSRPSSGSPATRLAERLLAEAVACPALIARRGPVDAATEPQPAPFPALALLSDPVLDVRPYLEDLVSIAVASAQRAEEMSAQVRQVSRKARRETLIVGCFGMLGLVIGAIGLAA